MFYIQKYKKRKKQTFLSLISLVIIFIEPSTKSSQCSSLSDGESFECFGENDHMTARIDNNRSGTVVGETGVDLDLAPQIHRYGIEIIFEQF